MFTVTDQAEPAVHSRIQTMSFAALFAAPLFRQRSLDQMYRDLPQGIQDLGIIETVLDQLLGHLSRYGLYCLEAGGILLLLRIIIGAITGKQKKGKE